jgi:hypothetical protein
VLGVANPLGAAALVAVAALIALHLWDRRRRVVPVSTLFLWRRLPSAPLERRRRLRPDALFVLQLSAMLVLVAGLLRPWIATSDGAAGAPSLLIVLDVSASMQAREPEGTRLDLARERAAALVRDDAETMLVEAADRPRVAVRWTRDATLVRRRLETLEALDVAGDLAPAVALAVGEARARPGTRVAVFTDLPPSATGLPADDLAAVDYVQLGRTDDNVAVSRLTVDAPPFATPARTTATVVVRNHAGAPRRVVLDARVGDRPWARRELSLPAHDATTVELSDPPGAGVVTITLDADDALGADDTAFGWIGAGASADLLVVSRTPARENPWVALANAMPGGRAEVVAPAAFTTAHDRLVVFDGVAPPDAPPDAPPARTLVVSPPVGGSVCPVDAVADDAAVIDWDGTHPILAAQSGLEALAVTRASVLAAPPDADVVALAAARDRTFPFLVARERNGARVACLASGLAMPLAATDQLPLLLVTLGTLAWLDPHAATAPLVVRTGVPARDGAVTIVADRVGAEPRGARLVLASLENDDESAIGRDGGGVWPAATTAAATTHRAPHELAWWCWLAGAGLLAGEWMLWRRRRLA